MFGVLGSGFLVRSSRLAARGWRIALGDRTCPRTAHPADRHPIAEAKDLGKAMGDVDDRHALARRSSSTRNRWSASADVSAVVGSSSTSTRQSNASARATWTSWPCAADRCSIGASGRAPGAARARRSRVRNRMSRSSRTPPRLVTSRPAKMLPVTERSERSPSPDRPCRSRARARHEDLKAPAGDHPA